MIHLSLQVCWLRRYCSSNQLTAWSLRVLRSMTSAGCLKSTKRCSDRLRGDSGVVMTSWPEELTIWWVMKSGYLLTIILVELRLTGSLKLTNEITVDLTRLSKIKYFNDLRICYDCVAQWRSTDFKHWRNYDESWLTELSMKNAYAENVEQNEYEEWVYAERGRQNEDAPCQERAFMLICRRL